MRSQSLQRNTWRRYVIKGIVVFAVLAAVLGMVFYIQDGNKTKAREPAQTPAKAKPGVVVEGVVVPVRYSELSMPIAGVVKEIAVGEGQQVTEGQVLVRLASEELAAKVGSAQADLDRAQAMYQLAQEDLARMEAVYEKDGLSRRELDKSRSTYLQTKSDVQDAAAKLNCARAALAQTELRAPFAGNVAHIDCKDGEYVAAGKPVVRVGEMSAWRIQTNDLAELQIAKVREGAKATMTFNGLPDVELSGKVVSIGTFGEKKNGDITYTAIIEPDRYEPRLKWNMTAMVQIEE